MSSTPSDAQQTETLSRKVAYTLAAGAAVATTASSSEAAVIYSGPQDLDIGPGFSQDLDIDGDSSGDILLKNYVFGGGNYQGASVNFAPGKVVGFNAGLNYATALGEGVLVDAAATNGGPFAVSLAYGNNPNSEFDNAQGDFIGVEFPINGASHFGWVRVTIDNVAGSFVVNDWAYESEAGTGIATGATPEPGTLGLLAAGALGLSALRRKRTAA